MDYGKIVSTGWKQAWQHKTLWIFGFFISGGGISYSNNISNKFKFGRHTKFDLPEVESFLMAHLGLIFLLVAVAIVAFVIWIILSTISAGGLIDAAGQLKRGEVYGFAKAFGKGAHYFWRIFGLGLLTFIVAVAFVLLLALFGLIGFLIATALGILSLLILVPVLLIGVFIVTITMAMAQRHIVLRDRMVFDAIAEGFTLWKSHLGPSLLYTLIYVGLGLAVMMGTLLVIFVAIMPFVAVAFVNLIIAILIGIPVLLLILLVVDGLSGSAMHLMTTEFYFQLLEEGKPADVPPMSDAGTAPPSPPPPPPPPPLPENP